MNKILAIAGLSCLLAVAVSAGTLKAAAAEAIDLSDSKFEARGGRPPKPEHIHHGPKPNSGEKDDDDGEEGLGWEGPQGGPGGPHSGPHGGQGGWGSGGQGGWGSGGHGGHGNQGGHGGWGSGNQGGWGSGGQGGLSVGGGSGGWGSLSSLGLGGPGPLHGNESFGGPTVIALALPIALGLIIALWVAAYNTLRAPAPKIGYNAGIVENAGWGGNQAAYHVASGYGYADAAASDQHAALATNLATTQIVQAAATQGAAGAVAAGRALDELTHRVVRSIERQEEKQ